MEWIFVHMQFSLFKLLGDPKRRDKLYKIHWHVALEKWWERKTMEDKPFLQASS